MFMMDKWIGSTPGWQWYDLMSCLG